MDLTALPNPYDFANPVRDPEQFAGRAEELREIGYYLNHAFKSASAINIALVGDRAAGKTSLMNMIAKEAEKRDFVVVRIDLTESDVETEGAFFSKVFDALLTSACESGAFNGLFGRTYECYRDTVDAWNIPEDKTFCPFLFPVQFARSLSAGNDQFRVSDTSLNRDLAAIAAEVNRPIALLFDECDVLKRGKTILQKLRNLIMRLDHYLLVFSGTDALLPALDDVFSPIIRQFKKILVGPFSEDRETRDCILFPLTTLGIADSESLFDYETFNDVLEIHDLSGGRPYEIQLICHFMFRRLQEGLATSMKLTLDVLEDVRRELEATQDVSGRAVIAAVRHLSEEQLRQLRVFTPACGHATFAELWAIERTLGDDVVEATSESTYRAALDHAVSLGILRMDSRGTIDFAGDDFDRIYSKYYARNVGIGLPIINAPLEPYVGFRVRRLIARVVGPAMRLPGGKRPSRDTPLEVAEKFRVGEGAQVLDDDPRLGTAVYWSLFGSHNSAGALVSVSLQGDAIDVEEWVLTERSVSSLEELADLLQQRARVAVQFGWDLRFALAAQPSVPTETLLSAASSCHHHETRRRLADRHLVSMYKAYSRGDIERAMSHGLAADAIDPRLESKNDLGYISMASGDWRAGLRWLGEAVDAEETRETALAYYNYALALCCVGRADEVQSNLERALAALEGVSSDLGRVGILLVAEHGPEGQLVLREERTVDLADAIDALGRACASGGPGGGHEPEVVLVQVRGEAERLASSHALSVPQPSAPPPLVVPADPKHGTEA